MEKNKIRNLLYNTREELFPKEEEFLNNISTITISY